VAIELATAYVSLVPETTKLEAGLKQAFNGVGKQADLAGKDMGSRLARTASKALKDGWRPDQDIMAGIPNTKLDRIGARIGQVIGKGVVGGLKARQLGSDFGKSFASGAGSVGLGSVISGWRADMKGQSNKLGFLAGKGISAGLQVGLAGATAIVGTALKTGFDRLVALDTAQNKLRAILRTQGNPKDFDRINKAVQAAVDQTPFSLDQAFGTAVQAIGAGAKDIERFMQNVSDAAGFAGTDLDRMGLIFNQVLAKGKLTGEETMQLMEAGLPARSWIQESYNLTADQFDKMQEDGEITLEMLQKSVERFAPGMAKALGNTLQGSIDNMQTSLARTGANLLAAIFGGPTGDATEGLKSAVQRITEMLNNLNTWIVANKDKIRDFFEGAKDAAAKVVEVLGSIANLLREHPGLITAAVAAFAAVKTIQGISAVATALTGVNAALGLMPGRATAALGPIGALVTALGALSIARSQMEWGNGDPVSAIPTPSDFDLGRRSPAEILLGPFAGRAVDGLFGGPDGGGNMSSGTPMVPGSGNAAQSILGGMAGASGGNVTGGGLGGGVLGTAGRGYFNSRAAAAQLGRRTDATLLSAVPAGQYSQTSAADLTQGLADCSSAIEDLVNIMDGRPTAGREMSTHNAQEWLASRGFRPGTAPGAFNVGFNSEHMQATLPGGTNFNWGSNSAAANRGIGGTGAFDPALTQRFYRYDRGGVLPPGMTLVENATGENELVLNPEQQQSLADQGIDPASLLHGSAAGAPPGPPNAALASGQGQPNYGMDFVRSLGFVPASAGNTGVAGTSSLANFIGMGNEVVGGLIDTGTNLAQMAVSAAITGAAAAGSFGAGAAAAPAASAAAGYGIQLLGNTAKRLSSYGFQMAGIGADALMEQLSPFGMPRWLGYDYGNFMPQIGIQEAALSTVEKMGADAIAKAFPQPGAPAEAPANTPMTMPASQPLGPPPGPDSGVNLETSGPAATPPPSAPLPLPNMLGLFDEGGMLQPGGIGINMTNRPEPVLTPQQWEAITASSSAPSQGAPLVQNLYAQDMQDAIRQLDKVKRRDMMQYSGRP
jgi:tape measure domain-containing protein